jgi:hypothetical protein
MIIEIDNQYFDFLPLPFIVVGFIGYVLAVLAFILSRKVKNKYKNLVFILFVLTIALFIGAIVLGMIGLKPVRSETFYGVFYVQHPCVRGCVVLGSGAGLFGIMSLIIHFATKNIVIKTEEQRVMKNVEIQKETSECIFYQEFSQGAIEVKEDYIVFYRNWLPFTKFKKGRVSTLIFINDIQHIEYKGSGWLAGVLLFTFKHPNKPLGIKFSKWLVGRSKKLNMKMTPIYEYIRGRVINNNK